MLHAGIAARLRWRGPLLVLFSSPGAYGGSGAPLGLRGDGPWARGPRGAGAASLALAHIAFAILQRQRPTCCGERNILDLSSFVINFVFRFP